MPTETKRLKTRRSQAQAERKGTPIGENYDLPDSCAHLSPQIDEFDFLTVLNRA
jgi:hypothetical protein